MHYRDFNAIAAELREGDALRLELTSGANLKAELSGPVILGSPARNGEVTVTVDSEQRRITAAELDLIDLVVE